MDLKDFVAETLVQIVEGVAISADRISGFGGAVSPAFSPSSTHEGRFGTTKDGRAAPVYGVAFDVAVAASSVGTQEGGARLEVAGFGGFGGKKGTGNKEERTSRVQFVVPRALPTDPKSHEAAKAREAEEQARVQAMNDRIEAHNHGSPFL